VSQDATTLLFGLEGLAVREVVRDEAGDRVLHAVTDDPSAAACPVCGVFSERVRQRRVTRPRDVRFGEEPLAIRWHKVQYACDEAPCPRRAFTESTRELPPRARLTGRLRRAAGRMVDAGASVSAACLEHRMAWPAGHRSYVGVVDARSAAAQSELPAVTVLGIDETRRGRPTWELDPTTGRWVGLERFETNLVCLGDGFGGGAGLLAQVAGRASATVVEWLEAQPEEWRAGITVVAMDPAATYRKAVREALPHARIVVDHFHLVRLGNQMVTEVRQRTTRANRGRRGTSRDPEWVSRRRLLTAAEHLRPETQARLWSTMLTADPTLQLVAAWIAKEELRSLMAVARRDGLTRPYEIRAALQRFYGWCAESGTPEVERLAATIEAWWPETLGFLETGITNAATEGTNRLIKHAGRVACGFRNLENQRRRVASAAARHPRQAAAA
jgi:transposase